MGIKLFGVDIAAEVKKAMGQGLIPIKLVKEVAGARNASTPAAGTAIAPRTYACRGFVSNYKLSQFDGVTVQRGDRKVVILGDTLPRNVVPEANDQVVAEKVNLVIIGVTRDPAAATYVCQVRG